jgi:hypothetical protein
MSRRVRLKIRYKRQAGLVILLTLAVLVVALLGYLALGQREAAASARPAPLAAASGLRLYYLTTSGYNGANADTACASGYHMASLWEILDPSNLKYNTSLGQVTADSGQGPPLWPFWGWVRTGYSSDNSTTPGRANCNAWSTTSGKGTYAGLTDNWTGGLQDIHVWNVDTATWDCSAAFRVWCVADNINFPVYLPLILHNF